jgi:hypothetical protein
MFVWELVTLPTEFRAQRHQSPYTFSASLGSAVTTWSTALKSSVRGFVRGFRLQKLLIFKLGLNQNHYTFTSISLIEIVLYSGFPWTQFINYKCCHMRLATLRTLPLLLDRSPQRALPTGTDVESGSSQSKSETSVNSSNSGELGTQRDQLPHK